MMVGRFRPAAVRLLSDGSKPPYKPRPKLALSVTQVEEMEAQLEEQTAPTALSNHLEDEFFRMHKKFPRQVPGWDKVELRPHPTSDADELRKAFETIRDTLAECGHFHDKQKQVMMQLASKVLGQDFTSARTSWD